MTWRTRCLGPFVTKHALAIAAACLIAVSSFGKDIVTTAGEVSNHQAITLGQSFEGRPIEYKVHGTGPDVLFVIATIHGNEAAGTPLVAAFEKWLLAHPAELTGKQAVLVPVANPDGFASGKRFNFRGVDINRNFPAGNWDLRMKQEVAVHGDRPLSEPESRALMQLVCRYFPSRVVSIHQPLECIDYDGPAKDLAEAMAEGCALPVKKLGGRPGSFGSFIGETLGKPIVTLELPKDAGMNQAALWNDYGKALIEALRFSAKPAKAAAEAKEELSPR